MSWLAASFAVLLACTSTLVGPKPVILDVDPGIDDAVALLLAARSPEIDVRGVTVVFGNVEAELGLLNALKILELAGRADIPVALGEAGPLVGEPLTAKNVHGDNGLGNVELPAPKARPRREGALRLIARVLQQSGEPVTLVPVGPLTNIALFLKVHPELRSKIREIVIMGGTTSVGTVKPTVSFNVLNDPEAAAIVHGSGLPITMVGFNVTRHVVLSPERIPGFSASDDPVARFVDAVVSFHRNVRGAEGLVVHDPLALAVAIDPSFVRTEPIPVEVELRGDLTRGQTVVDLRDVATWRTMERSHQTKVALEVESERFLRFLVERLEAARN